VGFFAEGNVMKKLILMALCFATFGMFGSVNAEMFTIRLGMNLGISSPGDTGILLGSGSAEAFNPDVLIKANSLLELSPGLALGALVNVDFASYSTNSNVLIGGQPIQDSNVVSKFSAGPIVGFAFSGGSVYAGFGLGFVNFGRSQTVAGVTTTSDVSGFRFSLVTGGIYALSPSIGLFADFGLGLFGGNANLTTIGAGADFALFSNFSLFAKGKVSLASLTQGGNTGTFSIFGIGIGIKLSL
jgi:hypothetical protein